MTWTEILTLVVANIEILPIHVYYYEYITGQSHLEQTEIFLFFFVWPSLFAFLSDITLEENKKL